MIILEEFDKAVTAIEDRIEGNQHYSNLKDMAFDLKESLYEREIIKELELNPNELAGPTINFKLYGLPESIVLKVWTDSDIYYCGLFKQHYTNIIIDGVNTNVKNHLDIHLSNTFNEMGIASFNTIDDLEIVVINYLANTYVSKNNTTVV